MAVTTQQVAELYVATFNRAPDAAGLAYWISDGTSATTTLTDINAIASAMQANAEADLPGGVNTMTNTEYVISLYSSMFGRTVAADSADVTYWVDGMTAGSVNRANLIQTLILGAQASTGSATDAAVLANKTTVGLYYANAGLNTSTFSLSSITSDDATVTAAQATIDQTVTPAVAMSTATTDLIIGTSKNDTFTGTLATFQTGDMVVDQSTTDNDTINVTGLASAAVTPTLSKIENVNLGFEIAAASVANVNATNFSGVKNLTVNRADLADGAISGAGTATLTNVDAAKVTTVTAGTKVNALNVTQVTTAGATIEASNVTGAIAVTGAATVNANSSTTTVAVDGGISTAEDAKAVVVNAAKAATSVTVGATTVLTGAVTINAAEAATVTVGTGAYTATGAVEINAAKATTVTVNNAAAGATINAEKGATTGITVKGIDDSGATVTTGSYASTAAGTITIGGTAGTADAATVKAAGTVNLTTNSGAQLEKLTLEGNGAAVTYNITGAPTTTTLSGDQSVTVGIAAAGITGQTMTDSTTGGTTTLKLTGAAGTADLSKVTVDAINMSVDNTNNAVTVANNADVTVAVSQTAGTQILSATDNANVTVRTTGTATVALNAIDMYNDATHDFANVSLVAGATTTASTADFTGATVGITGSKNVTFTGAVTATEVNASGLTGNLSMTVANTNTKATSGSGDDSLTLNGTSVLTVNAGDGTNTITVTDAGVGSTIQSGAGADTVNLNTTNGVVISTGAGDDTVNVGAGLDIDAVLNGGAGTADKIVFAAGAGADLSDNTNFGFAGFETLDITALTSAATISNTQFNNQTFTLKGDAAADTLTVKGTSSADTINVSSITTSGGATLQVQGGAGADIMTASNSGTTFLYTAASEVASGETVTGGTGTDIVKYTGTASIDFSSATIRGVETLDAASLAASATLTIGQGTGITSIATGTFANAQANTFVIAGSYSTLAGSAAAVSAAGQYYFTQEGAATDSSITYWDTVLGQAQTITLTGTSTGGTAGDDTAALVAGNIVVSIA